MCFLLSSVPRVFQSLDQRAKGKLQGWAGRSLPRKRRAVWLLLRVTPSPHLSLSLYLVTRTLSPHLTPHSLPTCPAGSPRLLSHCGSPLVSPLVSLLRVLASPNLVTACLLARLPISPFFTLLVHSDVANGRVHQITPAPRLVAWLGLADPGLVACVPTCLPCVPACAW